VTQADSIEEVRARIADDLASIDSVVDTQELLARSPCDELTQDYYRNSGLAYRLLHSGRGAMHMALCRQERPRSSDLVEQIRMLVREVDLEDEDVVLELGSGNAFNLIDLYDRYPRLKLVGIDLSESNTHRARRMVGRRNISLIQGSFNRLPIKTGTVDVAFAVESVCYSMDHLGLLQDVRRVLKPGGRFIVFDAFRADAFHEFDPTTQRAAVLAEAAMALPAAITRDAWLGHVLSTQMQLEIGNNLTELIRPSLLRFQRMSRTFFRFPRVARTYMALGNRYVVENAVAGLLLPETTAAGLHTYWMSVLRAPGSTEALVAGEPSELSAPQQAVAGVYDASPDVSAIHHSKYRTHHADFRVWADSLLESPSGHIRWRLFLIVVGYFLVGLAIALTGGFPSLYLRSPAVYIFCGSTAFGFVYLHLGSKSIHPAAEEMRPIFTVSDEVFRRRVIYWFERTINTKGILLTGAVVFGLFSFAVGIAVYARSFLASAGLIALRPNLFGASWYVRSDVAAKTLVFLWLGLIPSLLIGSGLWIIWQIWAGLTNLRDLPVIPLTAVVRMRLRRIVNFFILVSMGWFLGEGFIALLFTGHFGNLFWVSLGIIVMIGILSTVVPQLLGRHYLLKSYSEMCTWALRELYEAEGLGIRERDDPKRWMEIFRQQSGAMHLHNLIEATTKPNLWVYDSEDFLVLALGQSAAAVLIILQIAGSH
jgi:arsenite methyltransferase